MHKILIIEDDQLVANIYRNKFAIENFQADSAPDGESGYAMLDTFKPDIILLDLMLPKASGVEVLKLIRARPEYRQLPVVVFSNTYLSNMVQEAWKAGATKCLSKANCTPNQIVEVVRSLLPGGAGSAAATGAPATSAAAKPAQSGSGKEPQSDAAFQADLRKSFLNALPGTIALTRLMLQALAKTTDEAGRVKHLQELYRRIHTVTGNAGIAGFSYIGQMADALEALIKELYEKPKDITASTLRTVATAIDFLGMMAEKANVLETHSQSQAKTNILVVDDEAISRRAVTYALEKGKLQSVSVDNPEAALNMLAEKAYDLVFLDVDMPGMNGFELCTRLRGLQRNKTTPVVFVTSLSDFESRANSTISGGNDLIAKPFLFIELTVKALIFLLRGRLATAR